MKELMFIVTMVVSTWQPDMSLIPKSPVTGELIYTSSTFYLDGEVVRDTVYKTLNQRQLDRLIRNVRVHNGMVGIGRAGLTLNDQLLIIDIDTIETNVSAQKINLLNLDYD